MKEDEITKWLSDDERALFVGTRGGRRGEEVLSVLRSLAETRKALVEHEFPEGDGNFCASCGGTTHKLACIFWTMPRPR